MTMYKNGQQGFSIIGAVVGAVVGVALIATGAIAVVGPLGALTATGGGIIGGIAGGLLGPDSSKDGSGSDGSGTASSTEAGGEEAPVECEKVTEDLTALQADYQKAQQTLEQAQANLAASAQYGTSTSNDYDNNFQMCFDGSAGQNQYPCGKTTKDNACPDQQNQCNALAAQINSTNLAACQIQSKALQVMPGGTASSTANPAANAFTLGVTPSSVPVGGSISLVTTISVSNISSNAIKSFSVNILDKNGTVVGTLSANTTLGITAKTVTLQYNYQLSPTLGAGSYKVKIFNDANASEFATANLTITGSGTTPTTTSANGFGITVSPTSIYQGGSFTVNASISSPDVKSYSIGAFQSDFSLGTLASNVALTSTSRPVTIQQTFKTSPTIPPGTYSIRIFNESNPSVYQGANLIVQAGSGAGFTPTGGTATQGVGVTGTYTAGAGAANACNLGTPNLQVGSRDAATGGKVSALQNFLTAAGFYKYQVTGYFGPITKTAVQAFQSANGVPSTGLVGPLTRAAMSKSSLCAH